MELPPELRSGSNNLINKRRAGIARSSLVGANGNFRSLSELTSSATA
jgi:hypothetical protein